MGAMKCCANCIGDPYLRKEVFPKLSTETGTCPYCGSDRQFLLEPTALRDAFELLVSIYSRNDEGKTLVEWFKDDWAMFSHSRMDVVHAKELLANILDDREIVRQRFIPSDQFHAEALDGWEKLRSELMHENRFFPNTKFNIEQLGGFLEFLVHDRDELPAKWYRARLQETDEAYPPDKMGVPPKQQVSHGRANPVGIPYLYLASTVTTAISEIRPHTGEMACVAEFFVPGDLRIIDLRNPRKTVSPFKPDTLSPFTLDDEDKLALLRGGIGLLERLGEELTRPVLPQAAAIHYIPSQYLCEFIKKCGYHGVMYRSSVVEEGMNFALFEPVRATVGSVTQHLVSRVSVEWSERNGINK